MNAEDVLRKDLIEHLRGAMAGVVVEVGNQFSEHMILKVKDERDQSIGDVCGPCQRGVPLAPPSKSQEWLVHVTPDGQSFQCKASAIRRRWEHYGSIRA